MKGIELLDGPIVCFVVSFIGGIFSAIKAISIVTPIASLVVYFSVVLRKMQKQFPNLFWLDCLLLSLV